MSKDTKKDDRVTIRLPEELRNFEAYGFKNISEYIKAALNQFNSEQEYEVLKTAKILESISKLIEILEAKRDYDGISVEKEKHIDHLYQAAKALASSQIMLNSRLNYIEDPFDEELGREVYRYTWALS